MKYDIYKRLCRTAGTALLCTLALGMLSMPADAAKRRTFKTSTTKKQPTVSTVPTGDAEDSSQNDDSASAASSKTTTQSRSARRRSALPAETNEANSSVKNQTSTASANSKNTSKSMTTSSTSKSNVAPNQAQNNKKPITIKVSKPNLEQIKKETLNPKSNFYYPKLWAKYNAKQPKMTPEEYRYLYLGYMFQEDYDPYRISVYAESVDSMRDRDSYTRKERDDLIKQLNMSLKDNPFDLRQMSFLVHLLNEADKGQVADVWEQRLENLLAAIRSTGTGESKENAWFVIYPMHEYDIVQLLGYQAVDIDYTDDGYDHLLVQPNGSVKINKPAKGFYFNVQIPQEQYVLKHPDSSGEGADM